MGAKTGIEWTDATWNPIIGCSRVSEGCRHCYAEGIAARFERRKDGKPTVYSGLTQIANGHPQWTGKIVETRQLSQPLSWRKPKRVFVNSMSDLFHENVSDELRDRIFAVMALCPQHAFQVLTKRPGRMLKYLTKFKTKSEWRAHLSALDGPDGIAIFHEDADCQIANAIEGCLGKGFNVGWPMRNVWLGVSAENQPTADERIPLLLQTPAAIRYLSAEPLLGEVKVHEYGRLPRAVRSDLPFPPFLTAPAGVHALRRNPHGAIAVSVGDKLLGIKPDEVELLPTLDWVICGGESGAGARPMHPAWARSLRDQCADSGVPFFFKQWGEWAPSNGYAKEGTEFLLEEPRMQFMQRVGKKTAGALLDGREWKQFPS